MKIFCPVCKKSYRFNWVAIWGRGYLCKKCKHPIELSKIGRILSYFFFCCVSFFATLLGIGFWMEFDKIPSGAGGEVAVLIMAYAVAVMMIVIPFWLLIGFFLPFFFDIHIKEVKGKFCAKREKVN